MSKRKSLPKTIPSSMDDMLSPPEAGGQERPSKWTNETERKRGRKRAKHQARYDLPPGMKEKISQEATKLGVPASQLAALLLACALVDYDNGEIDPQPYLIESTSPKYRNNLEFEWEG